MALVPQILPIDASNFKKLVRDEIRVVKRPGKFIVVLVDLSMGNITVILKVNRREFKWETCQNHFSEN